MTTTRVLLFFVLSIILVSGNNSMIEGHDGFHNDLNHIVDFDHPKIPPSNVGMVMSNVMVDMNRMIDITLVEEAPAIPPTVLNKFGIQEFLTVVPQFDEKMKTLIIPLQNTIPNQIWDEKMKATGIESNIYVGAVSVEALKYTELQNELGKTLFIEEDNEDKSQVIQNISAKNRVSMMSMVQLRATVSSTIEDIDRFFADPNEDTSDMTFTGLLLLNDIKKYARTVLLEADPKAMEKDTSSPAQQLFTEVQNLLDRLNGRLDTHNQLIIDSRNSCATNNSDYKALLKTQDSAMSTLRSDIASWTSSIALVESQRDTSIADTKTAITTLRHVYDLRRNDRSIYRYNTTKRKRANLIIDLAISLVCTLDSSKGETNCKGVELAPTMSMEYYGSSDSLAIFSKEILSVRNKELKQALTQAKAFIETKGEQAEQGDNAFILQLLLDMKNKNIQNQANDTKQLAYNLDNYRKQEVDLIATLTNEQNSQKTMKANVESYEGNISSANLQNGQIYDDNYRTSIALDESIVKCGNQENEFARTYVTIQKQIGVVRRLQSLLRTIDYKGLPACDAVKNCSGDQNGFCIFATMSGDSAMCVCRDLFSGSNCEFKRCPTRLDKIFVEYIHPLWACSGRGACNKTTGECTCDDTSQLALSHGPNKACEVKACPAYDQSGPCGGDARSETCNSYHGVCTCRSGYRAKDCSFKECPKGCSGNSQGTCGGNGVCACTSRWNGSTCAERSCNGCGDSTQGSCVTTGPNAGKCGCLNGYWGSACQNKSCPDSCSGHGTCDTTNGTCICKEGWSQLNNCSKDNFDITHGIVSIGNAYSDGYVGIDVSNVQTGKYIEFNNSKVMCMEPVVIAEIVGGGDTSSDAFLPETFAVTTYNVSDSGFYLTVACVDAYTKYNVDGWKKRWGTEYKVHYSAYCKMRHNSEERIGRFLVTEFDIAYTASNKVSNAKRNLSLAFNTLNSSDLSWAMTPEYKGTQRAAFALTHIGREQNGTLINVVRVSPCVDGTLTNKFNIGTCGWDSQIFVHYHAKKVSSNYFPDNHKVIPGNGPQWYGMAGLPSSGTAGTSNVRVLNNKFNYASGVRPDIFCYNSWKTFNKCIHDQGSNCKMDFDSIPSGSPLKKLTAAQKQFYSTKVCGNVITRERDTLVNTCSPKANGQGNECFDNWTFKDTTKNICTFNNNNGYIKFVKCPTTCTLPSVEANLCASQGDTVQNQFVPFPSTFTCASQKIVLHSSIRGGNSNDTFAHTAFGLNKSGFYVNFARVDNCNGNSPFPCSGWSQNPVIEWGVTCMP